MEVQKYWYLVWFLMILLCYIFWIIEYPKELRDVLLFKADTPGWSIGFWGFIIIGITSLILYLIS